MGLGQTLAFLRAKGKNAGWDEHTILNQHISSWVVAQIGKSGELLDVVRQESSEVYRQATAEALAFLGWLKRFAEAELPEAEGD
jgi:CRISPR-associated protein Cmr5